MPRPQSDKLTGKQREFCRQYVKDRVGGRAARRAGYSSRTADSQACTLLKLPKIIKEIDRLNKELDAEFDIEPQRILRGVARIAQAEIPEDAKISSQTILQALQLLVRVKGMDIAVDEPDWKQDAEGEEAMDRALESNTEAHTPVEQDSIEDSIEDDTHNE